MQTRLDELKTVVRVRDTNFHQQTNPLMTPTP